VLAATRGAAPGVERDGDRVPAPIRYEVPEPGAEEYPHIYGPLALDAVTAAIPLERDAAGTLLLP
jgi:uncharacterized protein (DUF952 family)